MKRIILWLLLLLKLIPVILGQELAGRSISADSLTPWESTPTNTYEGLYRFGFSEDESDLLILVEGETVYAQLGRWEWSDDGQGFVMHYQNLTNVRITKDLFQSDQATGDFVSCNYGGAQRYGLHIQNPWSQLVTDAKTEIGLKQVEIMDAFEGRFPEASSQLLSEETTRMLDRQQLRIMRNEIFARYGYIFRAGGAMEAHFQQQAWYHPQHKDVNAFLTELEKKNIALIQKIEAEK